MILTFIEPPVLSTVSHETGTYYNPDIHEVLWEHSAFHFGRESIREGLTKVVMPEPSLNS